MPKVCLLHVPSTQGRPRHPPVVPQEMVASRTHQRHMLDRRGRRGTGWNKNRREHMPRPGCAERGFQQHF